MDFQGSGTPLTESGLGRVCEALGVTAPALWAVVTVETRGFGFLPERRPLILFERHVFHRRTNGRFTATAPNVSDPQAGGYIGGAAEYERLNAAIVLDRRAALESASWGIGQVMGFNHQVAGFDSAEEMVAAMLHDETNQLLAMAKFISGNGLDRALRRHDWASFAHGYNGAEYARNEYDRRLHAAHVELQKDFPDLRLRAMQAALLYAGFDPGRIDGVLGKKTRAALLAFQATHGLAQTGDQNSDTEARLFAVAFRDGSGALG
jgi:hypothetical protein